MFTEMIQANGIDVSFDLWNDFTTQCQNIIVFVVVEFSSLEEFGLFLVFFDGDLEYGFVLVHAGEVPILTNIGHHAHDDFLLFTKNRSVQFHLFVVQWPIPTGIVVIEKITTVLEHQRIIVTIHERVPSVVVVLFLGFIRNINVGRFIHRCLVDGIILRCWLST